MKSPRILITLVCLITISLSSLFLLAQDKPAAAPYYEYVTIRWGGRDNTHLIRPGGEVEFIGQELRKLSRPSGANDRSFYMNVAMNGLSKGGWEFAGMTNDDIIMKRSVGK